MSDRIISVDQKNNGAWHFVFLVQFSPGIRGRIPVNVPPGIDDIDDARAAAIDALKDVKRKWIKSIAKRLAFDKAKVRV